MMLLSICFLPCLQKLLLALTTIFLVLQRISWVRAPSLFNIWSDLFHEFIVDGGFASHFSPLRNKNRESNGRPCLNSLWVVFFFFFSVAQISVGSTFPRSFFGTLGEFLSSKALNTWPGKDLAGWGGILARLWVGNQAATTLEFVHSMNIYGTSTPSQDLDCTLGTMYEGTAYNPCPPRAYCLWKTSES